ncbi:MAG: hypothetical protein ABDH49_02025 [Candidatus Hydrothermales bacterium]
MKVFRNIKQNGGTELKESVYFQLSLFYQSKNEFDSAYFYIGEIVESKSLEEVEQEVLSSYARMAYKKVK